MSDVEQAGQDVTAETALIAALGAVDGVTALHAARPTPGLLAGRSPSPVAVRARGGRTEVTVGLTVQASIGAETAARAAVDVVQGWAATTGLDVDVVVRVVEIEPG